MLGDDVHDGAGLLRSTAVPGDAVQCTIERTTQARCHPIAAPGAGARVEVEGSTHSQEHLRPEVAVKLVRRALAGVLSSDPNEIGCLALMSAMTAASPPDSMANGGQNVPTTCNPGSVRPSSA
jgi:hypothetical protein